MPTAELLRNTLDAYFGAIAAIDPSRIAALFAEDGEIEHPLGTEMHRGRAAVAQYFSVLEPIVAHIEIQRPSPRCRVAGASRRTGRCRRGKNGREVEAEGIDVLQVNEQGQIVRAEGYWNLAGFVQALAGSCSALLPKR